MRAGSLALPLAGSETEQLAAALEPPPVGSHRCRADSL